ncbi:MAG: AMP-binding protein [Muribaculaceae bacterium]|nr:AMP-binding protein [Muribaculaceae bacterium]
MDNSRFGMAGLNDFAEEWLSENDFIVAHTSGSTGKPKEIKLPKADMRVSALATNKRFHINSGSTIAAPLSVNYIAGKMMWVRAHEASCHLLDMPVSNEVIVSHDIDLLAVVPSQVESLLSQPEAADRIKNMIIGGAPLSSNLRTKLIEKGFNAYMTYGMTETCSHVALSKISDTENHFEAMPGISFDCDERGCLIINAPQYSFRRLVTNDIVKLIDTTSFTWVGRYDNVINSGGIKISPEQLENRIKEFIDLDFYVVGEPDEKWGQIAVMIFEGDKNRELEIIEILRSKLDHRLCPKKAIAVKSLPKTSNGKIRRMTIGEIKNQVY